ncbi:GMC oxidoreductase [Gigaspora rosea]|uniref:GMC oxidoreductase n=1 Tax=Gigaspora rosea TaxID=44941 RepID=A0A397VLW2_9GLOM|nr:GMC oxidoreductase [Gigaspora rosea]
MTNMQRAGTAGCVLARELIHGIPNINILVLEASGPNAHSNGLISLPCTWFQAFQLYDHDWGYVTQEQKMKSHVNPIKEAAVKNGVPYPRGKAKQYNDWAAQGPEYKIWDWDHCLEAFKALENNLRENPDEEFKQFHGFNSLHHVQDFEVYDILSGLVDVAKNLGIPYNDDFNVYEWRRKRCSLADCYLRDALKKVEFHPGAEPNGFRKVVAVDIRSYTHVLEIIWDEENKKENIAIGVRYFCNGTVHEAFIAPKGEVIICSGAINSPQILMLSGVGPKENLEANNIKVRKQLPVGRNLLDHPNCLFAAKSTPEKIHHWSSGSEVGIIHKANVEGKIPCKKDFFDENPDIQIIGIIISLLKLSREIIKQPPLSTVYNIKEIGINDEFGQWITNGDDLSDEDWEKLVFEKSNTMFHPSGTAKMAPESKGGVVNHRL